jgi:hypothetical protein
MVIKKQGFGSTPFTLGVHYWRAACGQDLHRKTALAEHLSCQLGALLQPKVLGGNAGLSAKTGELNDAFIEMTIQVSIN